MFKIAQYEIDPALQEPTVIHVPKGSKLLKVHSSCGEHMYAWFLQEIDAPDEDVFVFYTIPTNWPLEDTHPIVCCEGSSVRYINSVFINDGQIIFHVFVSGPLKEIIK